jgi:hypothetical protein
MSSGGEDEVTGIDQLFEISSRRQAAWTLPLGLLLVGVGGLLVIYGGIGFNAVGVVLVAGGCLLGVRSLRCLAGRSER